VAEPTPSKRRVKNPETFRERAAKAAESDQPKRRDAVSSTVRPLGKVLRPIGRSLRRLGRTKPMRILGRIIFPSYFRNSWQELKLVTWPSWRESRRLTFAVLVFAVIFGASIAIVDLGLDKLFRNILLKG